MHARKDETEGRRQNGAVHGNDGQGTFGAREAEAPLRWQPADREGRWRRPVQAYITAMPGWKRDVGRRLDALIVRTVPNVIKAVRWNSPFYGVEGRGWFLSYHCFTKYVKVTFFRGTALRPVPPVASKDENVRHFHVHEDIQLDEERVVGWIRQASELPGWVP